MSDDKKADKSKEAPAAGETAVDPEAQARADKAIAEAAKRSGGQTIHAKVFAPFQEYFEGEAYSISAVNESGPFDVLAKHHNFITMLLPCELIIRSPEGEKTFRITRGLMHVRDSKVIVFLDV